MTFFTADLHLNGFDVCTEFARPFRDVKHMNHQLIENINSMCSVNDTLYVVGDLFSYNEGNTAGWRGVPELIKLIKPKVILLLGNHESRIIRDCYAGDADKFSEFCLEWGISAVILQSCVVKMNNLKYKLSHNPCDPSQEVTPAYGMMGIYGHVHMSARASSLGLNVGVDLTGYMPVSENYIYNMCRNISLYNTADRATAEFSAVKDTYIFDKYYSALKQIYEV